MRLTKSQKQSIVLAVMRDAPQIDYHEKEKEIIEKAIYRNAPKEIKAVLDAHELHRVLENRSVRSFLISSGGSYRYSQFKGIVDKSDNVLNASDLKKIESIKKKHLAQLKARKNAEAALESAIEAFSTTNKLREAMPSLDKYIPADEEKIANLPAVSNVMEALKSAGWKEAKKLAA